MGSSGEQTVVLDVDGTLVDTNYHHVVAWARAFAAYGVRVPLWRVHRSLGMGGDKLVAAVAGDEVERAHGDDIRDQWKDEFDQLIDEVKPLPGAGELMAALRERGVRVALASSAHPDHAHFAFELLGAGDFADAATSAEDAEESKPDSELVEAAIGQLGGSVDDVLACVVGDSVYDVQAAAGAGLPAYAVLTGGVSRAELAEAGAAGVYTDLPELLEHLDEWLPG